MPVYSQESDALPVLPELEEKIIDWNQIHMGGISFQQSFKTIEVSSEGSASDVTYSLLSPGIHYAGYSGSLIGFLSDFYLSFPISSRLESGGTDNNFGVSFDYMGAVAWNLWAGPAGFLPYIGFHTQYTFLEKDPMDENLSNHMLSFGIGAGVKILFKLSDRHNLYTGINGCLDTIEFTNASYDSREVQLSRKILYSVSLGYAYTAPVRKKILQQNL
ncbi:MAG: hypothetical protein PQJ58_04585 [Spirochaetales bacterium]|nr:hypothetical protein [Spirochaetales bacterium]